jgi:tripartite-type tricarboxylate transporter receptor subunit TctC
MKLANMIGKTIVSAALIAVALSVPAAFAQTWPAKTVRIVVPQPPGGTTDLLARLLAKKYTETLGPPFVVENRAGASGIIGTEAVVRSPADGYTLLFTSASLSVSTAIYGSKLSFDPLTGLAPVTWLSSVPLLLTLHPSVPVRTVKELIALSKRQKGGLNGGHNGSGTTSHIALEMFRQQTGASMTAIPYKGGGPATIAILAGEIDFTFGTLSTVKPHVEGGRLRGIAVSTKKRSSVFPDLPTMDSIYPGFESDNWFGLFAPAGVPKEIIAKLNALAIDAMKSAEIRDVIAKDGGDLVGSTPEELGAHLKSEVARYSKVIKAGNIKAE